MLLLIISLVLLQRVLSIEMLATLVKVPWDTADVASLFLSLEARFSVALRVFAPDHLHHRLGLMLEIEGTVVVV